MKKEKMNRRNLSRLLLVVEFLALLFGLASTQFASAASEWTTLKVPGAHSGSISYAVSGADMALAGTAVTGVNNSNSGIVDINIVWPECQVMNDKGLNIASQYELYWGTSGTAAGHISTYVGGVYSGGMGRYGGASVPCGGSERFRIEFTRDPNHPDELDGYFVFWFNAVNRGNSVTRTLLESSVSLKLTRFTNDRTIKPEQLGGAGSNMNTRFDGGGGSSCSVGLPSYGVNTAFLNLVIEDTDFQWQSYGHDVALKRVWNMLPGRDGMFGNGWSFAYESVLRARGNEYVFLTTGSGQTYTYGTSSSQGQGTGTITSTYSSSPGIQPALSASLSEATGIGYYLLKDMKSKLTSRYDYASTDAGTGDKNYRLSSIADRNGNTLTLTYDSSARLAKLTDASNRDTTFTYDANNHCTKISTFNSKAVTFEYDASGNMTGNVDLAGNVIAYAYDASKLITSMTAAGKTTGFSYFDLNGEKRIASVTDAMGKVHGYKFDPYGSLTTITEPGGGSLRYEKSDLGLTASQTNPSGNSVFTVYNAMSLPISVYDPRNRKTDFDYDASGNLTKHTDPAGKITTFEYDTSANLTKTTDPLGNVWAYTYNATNNLTGVTSPLGQTTTIVVDSKGLVAKVTGPDGNSTTYAYDSNGNIASIANPLNQTATYGFDAFGLELISRTDPKGNTTAFSYDPNRLLASITYPDNNTAQYSYACNALMSATDGGGNTSTLERDNLLHVTKSTNPLGQFSSAVYNSDGFNTTTTDPLGRVTTLAYDAAHRITSVTNPLGKTVLFSRGADGRPASITNELGKTTTMSYDNRGSLLTISDPLARVATTRSYDVVGRISSVTGARGKAVSAVYDGDGRTTERRHDAATIATYNWNPANQLTSVTDSAGAKTFTRDAAGQVTAISYPDGLVLSITYDAAGNTSSISYPGGPVVNYSYDSRNRTSEVSFAASSVTFGYSPTGRLSTETRSNGVQSKYAYDAAGQLVSLSHKQGTSVIADLIYARNDAGLVIGESGSLPLNPDVASSSVIATYDNADAVLTWGGDNYTYDADGNLTAIAGAKTFSATYDNENRPISIALDGTTATYAYDGLGNRVRAQTTAATRNFHHDQWGRLLFETDASGLVTGNYVYAGNRLVASGTTAGGYVFYHQDKTGNTLALTDSSGAVVGAYAYSPYGAVLKKSGSITTPFTFVGAHGVMSEGNDLYFMKNRYYDAVTGRFIQRDPIGFAAGQSNLYAYAGGNPVTGIDPDGLMTWKTVGKTAVVVGGITAAVIAAPQVAATGFAVWTAWQVGSLAGNLYTRAKEGFAGRRQLHALCGTEGNANSNIETHEKLYKNSQNLNKQIAESGGGLFLQAVAPVAPSTAVADNVTSIVDATDALTEPSSGPAADTASSPSHYMTNAEWEASRKKPK